MRKVFLIGIVTVSIFPSMLSCGPSEEERRQAERIAEERKQKQAEAEKRIAEQQEQAKKAAAERRQTAVAEQHKRTQAVAQEYRAWIDREMAVPGVKPRRYYAALEEISLRENTLVLGLSIGDKSEAVNLCNFTLNGWWDREKYGVTEVEVVNTGDGLRLARSTHISTGAHVCK